MNAEPLWYWVKEREQIRIRKESGAPQPWTDDPILRTYRFCNVRREDDRGTVWIRENIREPFADHPNLWFMLCIARQINWPATLEELISKEAWPSNPAFKPAMISKVLMDRKARGEKVYTGAYMISAPSIKGANKQEFIAENVLGNVWNYKQHWTPKQFYQELQGAHAWLMQFKGWGPFMAYQTVVDMRFTKILRDAPDRLTWAAAGPGTIRGLNRLHGRPLKQALSQKQALAEMAIIYSSIQQITGVEMDFSDVPNALCETDKYLRVKQGEGKPRALYVEGRGA